MNQSQFFRIFAVAGCLAAAAACVDSDERRAEEALLTADSDSGGVQGLLSLNYEITSDVFKKWKSAQLALDRTLGRSRSRALKASIIGERPTRESIERSVARIEANASARRAIQQAGMSSRHYVVATVALFQATRGIDPITGEAFRGVPARNVEFAQRNREEIESAEVGEFQHIADSIAAARAGVDTTTVVVDTVQPAPVPTPVPVEPRPTPIPSPTPTPIPTQPLPTQPTPQRPATPTIPPATDQPALR